MNRTGIAGFSYDKMNLSTNAHAEISAPPGSAIEGAATRLRLPRELLHEDGTNVNYRISCWIKSKAKEAYMSALERISSWVTEDVRRMAGVFSPTRIYSGAAGIRWMLINKSSEPAFFDDFKVEEL